MEISLSDEPIMHSRILSDQSVSISMPPETLLSDQPVSISAPRETAHMPDSPRYPPTLAPPPISDSPPYPPADEWPPSTPYSPRSSSSNTLVIGGSIGGVLLLLLASFIGFYVWKMKKNSRSRGIPMQHGESPSTPKMVEDDLYIGSYRQQQSPPPPVDHVIELSSNTDSSLIPPPPLPGNLNSSDSVSECSGSEPLPRPSHGMVFGMSISTFTYEELVIATDGFSDANVLGEGGFGYVHKGVLSNGKEVAVKQLKSDSRQGDREFQAEVDIISRVHHKHLVSLVGYCISDGQRLLVYEFVPNSTLESHLHGHPKIIHRDIKAANILIDYNFEAKVADFGLAKFSEDNKTHVSTRIMGTFGYLAPEYASSGKLTEKSDLFSFGVILLELITGRRPVDMTPSSAYDSLVEWARPLLTRAIEDGNYETLVDPSLGKNYKQDEMAHMIVCATACVLPSAKCRPHMSQVVRALEGDTSVEDLTKGVKLSHNQYINSYNNSDNYKAMEEFRKIAMQSREYPSSQYSAPTGEYSLNTSGSGSEGQHKLEMEMGR